MATRWNGVAISLALALFAGGCDRTAAPPTLPTPPTTTGPTGRVATGTYTMTVVVDPVCSAIPEALRTRVYDAEVAPLSSARPVTQYSVVARGPFLQYGGFVLGIAENQAHFEDDMGFWEYLPSFTYLDFSGNGDATLEEETVSTLTLSYHGGFDYCALNSDRGRNNCYTTPAEKVITRVSCSAPNSKIILTRK